MPVREIARIEILVPGEPASWEAPLASRGFRRVPGRDRDGTRQVTMARGMARVVVTGDRVSHREDERAPGLVVDVAFTVDDVAAVYRRAVAAGARAVTPPTAWLPERPGLTVARVATSSGIRHTLCGYRPNSGDGSVRAGSEGFAIGSVSLLADDRAALTRLYADGFGFGADGGGLRSGDAVVLLADPPEVSCRPRPGSVTLLGFGAGTDATALPLCHLSCALAAAPAGAPAPVSR